MYEHLRPATPPCPINLAVGRLCSSFQCLALGGHAAEGSGLQFTYMTQHQHESYMYNAAVWEA